MSDSKKEYNNNKKNNKRERRDQQKSKNFKNTSDNMQDIPEGMYDKVTRDVSYLYNEKEVKKYSNNVSELFDNNKSVDTTDVLKSDIKDEKISNCEDGEDGEDDEDDENDEVEELFDDVYFKPVAYINKSKKKIKKLYSFYFCE